jgi:hypothetical protein
MRAWRKSACLRVWLDDEMIAGQIHVYMEGCADVQEAHKDLVVRPTTKFLGHTSIPSTHG